MPTTFPSSVVVTLLHNVENIQFVAVVFVEKHFTARPAKNHHVMPEVTVRKQRGNGIVGMFSRFAICLFI